jgi:hypothetical protein
VRWALDEQVRGWWGSHFEQNGDGVVLLEGNDIDVEKCVDVHVAAPISRGVRSDRLTLMCPLS